MLFSNCYLMWHPLWQRKALPGAQGPCPTTECVWHSLAPGFPFPPPHQLQDSGSVPSLGAGNSNQVSPLPTGPLPQPTADWQWPRVLQTLYQNAIGTWIWDGGEAFPTQLLMECIWHREPRTIWPLLCSTFRYLRMCLSNPKHAHSPFRPHLAPTVEGNRQRSQGGPRRQDHACTEAPNSPLSHQHAVIKHKFKDQIINNFKKIAVELSSPSAGPFWGQDPV